MSRKLTISTAAMALALSACGNDRPGGTTTTSTTEATTTTQSGRTTATASIGGDGSGTATISASGTDTALLSDVTVDTDDDVNSVTFEFRGPARPAVKALFLDGPIYEDGSGDEIEVNGRHHLEVSMEPASGFDASTDEGEVTYNGPNRLGGGKVVRAGDFEGKIRWIIGVDSRSGFTVTGTDDPYAVKVAFNR